MKKKINISKKDVKKAVNTAKNYGKNALKKENVKKAVSGANDFSKFMLENKYLLIAVGVGVVGYFIYKKVGKAVDSVGEGFKNIETDRVKLHLKEKKENLTITKEKATMLAKTLLEAFNYKNALFIKGTDKEKVRRVFEELKTPDDYILLYNTFGLRPYTVSGTPTSYLEKKFFYTNKDLNGWLRAELSSVLDSSLWKLVKARVESAGMIF